MPQSDSLNSSSPVENTFQVFKSLLNKGEVSNKSLLLSNKLIDNLTEF